MILTGIRQAGPVELRAARGIVAAALLAGSAQTATAVTTILPIETPFASTSDHVISYRQQNHSWQASDGAFHLLINTGNQPTMDALRLYTTRDRGATWTAGPTLASSNMLSTEDGLLVGDSLALVYNTVVNRIRFASFAWHPASGTWSAGNSQTVFASEVQSAANPCIARDSLGNLWVAFVTTDNATGDNAIRMMVRPAETGAWIDPGLTFGEANGGPVERSARPVIIPGGMGMVYTVHRDFYWATRSDSSTFGEPWTTQLLYTRAGRSDDPYASHFSVASDAYGNVHLVAVDGGELLYFRRDATSGTWSQRKLGGEDMLAHFPQVTVVGDMLIVAANVKSYAGVFTSPDLGRTFAYSFRLQHNPYAPGVSYQTPRLETAAKSTSPVLLFQQYVDHGIQRMLEFVIPVDEPSQ